MNTVYLQKEEHANFVFKDYFDITISACENISLFVFFKTKDNKAGFVCSESCWGRRCIGSLEDFPYIWGMEEYIHCGLLSDGPVIDCIEEIRISQIDEMNDIYIAAIDLDTVNDEKQRFSSPFHLDVYDDCVYGGHKLVPSITYCGEKSEIGSVCLIASIKGNNNHVVITNKMKFYTPEEAFESIPGFAQFCNRKRY